MGFNMKRTFEHFGCCFFLSLANFFRVGDLVYRKWCEAQLQLCVIVYLVGCTILIEEYLSFHH